MIGVLIFPDFQLLDAAGPISAFEIAARLAGAAPVIRTLAATPGPVRSSSGAEMLARGLKPSGAITTLIVAGGEGSRTAAACPKTLAFVRAMAKRGIRIASVCSGAFILAEAGLLDGRRATTHWQRTRQLMAAYPKVKLEADQIYTRDGNIWTSAGITAGIDLSLAMVAEDYGEEIAQQTAKQLVLYYRRSGGQSQFSSLLELKTPTGRFAPLLAWAQVVAGREHAARAAHDDHADSLVGLRQAERLADLGQQFVALGVQHLWPVEGNDPEGTFDVERDLPEVADLGRPAIAHARCLLPCRRSPLASIWLLATVRPGRGGLLNDARQRTATAQRYVRSR